MCNCKVYTHHIIPILIKCKHYKCNLIYLLEFSEKFKVVFKRFYLLMYKNNTFTTKPKVLNCKYIHFEFLFDTEY